MENKKVIINFVWWTGARYGVCPSKKAVYDTPISQCVLIGTWLDHAGIEIAQKILTVLQPKNKFVGHTCFKNTFILMVLVSPNLQ